MTKRRSQPKAKRDFEGEQLQKLTTVSMTESAYRDRLLADKAALEMKLRELFSWRNMLRKQTASAAQQAIIVYHNDMIRGISIELRAVKTSLKCTEKE